MATEHFPIPNEGMFDLTTLDNFEFANPCYKFFLAFKEPYIESFKSLCALKKVMVTYESGNFIGYKATNDCRNMYNKANDRSLPE